MASLHLTRGIERSRPAVFGMIAGTLMLVMALTGCTGGASGGDAKSQGLPSGFPSSIPLVSDDVKTSDKLGKAWSVTVNVDDEQQQKAALKKLKDKGFAVIGESGSTASDRSYSLASEKYSIRLGFGKSSDGFTLTYAVSPRAK